MTAEFAYGIGWRTPLTQCCGHDIHRRPHMFKKHPVAFAEIIKAGLPSESRAKRFRGHSPLQAKRYSQRRHSGGSEVRLAAPNANWRSLHIISTRLFVAYVPKIIFRKNKMVAAVDIAIEFYGSPHGPHSRAIEQTEGVAPTQLASVASKICTNILPTSSCLSSDQTDGTGTRPSGAD